jgi:hypothetical protein
MVVSGGPRVNWQESFPGLSYTQKGAGAEQACEVAYEDLCASQVAGVQ